MRRLHGIRVALERLVRASVAPVIFINLRRVIVGFPGIMVVAPSGLLAGSALMDPTAVKRLDVFPNAPAFTGPCRSRGLSMNLDSSPDRGALGLGA